MSKDKKPLQSKKFIGFVTGVSITSLFVLVGLIAMVIIPSASSAVVNLMTVALASINGMISLYCVGQSFVDWKINSNHNTTQENKIIDDKKTLVIEGKNHEFKYDDLDDLDWQKVDPDDLKDSGLFNFNFNLNKDE